MQNLDTLLAELGACQSATLWAQGKTWQQIYDTCERADWLLWLFARTQTMDAEVNMRLFTLAKVECAALVDPIWFDEESLVMMGATLYFGNGEFTEEEFRTKVKLYVADSIKRHSSHSGYHHGSGVVVILSCLTEYNPRKHVCVVSNSYTPRLVLQCSFQDSKITEKSDKQKILADTIRRVLPFHIWELSDPMFEQHRARLKQFNS